MSEPIKKIPGQNDPIPKEPTEEENRELLLDLMNGRVEPANDMAMYFMDKLSSLAKEGSELDQHIAQAEQQVKMLKHRSGVCRVESEAYKKDLLEWQRKE